VLFANGGIAAESGLWVICYLKGLYVIPYVLLTLSGKTEANWKK